MKENAKNDRGKPRNSQDLIAKAKAEAGKRAETAAKKATLKTDANGRKKVAGYDKSRPGEMPTLAQVKMEEDRAGAEKADPESDEKYVENEPEHHEEISHVQKSEAYEDEIADPTSSEGSLMPPAEVPASVISQSLPDGRSTPATIEVAVASVAPSESSVSPMVGYRRTEPNGEDFTDIYLREFNEPIAPERLLSPSALGFLRLAKEVGYETAGRLLLLIDIQRRCGKVDFFTHPELADFIGIGSRQVSKRMIDDLIKRGLVIDHGLKRSRRILDFSRLVKMVYPLDNSPA